MPSKTSKRKPSRSKRASPRKSSPTPIPRESGPSKAASLCSEAELTAKAQQLAHELKPGHRVVLEGPMGAGKTTFTRALLAALGVVQPPEGSPSFAIAHEYASPRGDVVHIDFYRIRHEAEIEGAGIEAYYWERPAIVISEWLSMWPALEAAVVRTAERVWRVELEFAQGDESRRCVLIS